MAISPGSSNVLRALDIMLQRQVARRRDRKTKAMQLLGWKIRQDEAYKQRLFTETRDTKRDMLSALSAYEEVTQRYGKMGGDVQEALTKLEKGKNYKPTKDYASFISKLSTAAGKDAEYLEDSIGQAYQKMQTLNEAHRTVEAEIGATQAFTAEYMPEIWKEAVTHDVDKPAMIAKRPEGMGKYYHQTYATTAEWAGAFKTFRDEHPDLNITRAMEAFVKAAGEKKSETRHTQLMREETLRLQRESLALRGRKTDQPVYRMDIQGIRQMSDKIDLIRQTKGLETIGTIKPDASVKDLTVYKDMIRDLVLEDFYVGADIDEGWFSKLIRFDPANVPKGISGDDVEDWKTTTNISKKKELADKLMKQILLVNLEGLDFSGDDKESIAHLVDKIILYRKVQQEQFSYEDWLAKLKPKEK